MIQHILTFIIVAFCLGVVIRLVLRVLAGKQSTCSLCNDCDVRQSCTKEPCADPPEDCPERPENIGKSGHCPR